MQNTQQKLEDWVNQSGFPLQIAVANAVEQSFRGHGWRVMYTEHAWRDAESNEDGFIDLVLHQEHRAISLIIECKRVLDSSWIFLVPNEKELDRRQAKAWLTNYASGRLRSFGWTDLALSPSTPQAEYCVIPGQDAKSKPMIERVGADLVSATQALAKEERKFLIQNPDVYRTYFSVLVTTARLSICTFDPAKIKLTDGKIESGTFKEVPFLRFRKQLSTHTLSDTEIANTNSNSIAGAKEHTVFVVQAESLTSFLEEFEIDRS